MEEVPAGFSSHLLELATQAHSQVISLFASESFIRDHGLFLINKEWLLHWLKVAIEMDKVYFILCLTIVSYTDKRLG